MHKLTIGLTVCTACVLVFAIGCGNPTTKEPSTSTAEGGTSTAPSGKAAANRKEALVRFVNGIPEGSATLSFGGTSVFSNVAYGGATPYQQVPADQKGFGLFLGNTAGGNAPPVASDDTGISSGSHYTVIAGLDNNAKPKLTVVGDNLSQPANGKAKVRVINASDDEIDVFAPQEEKRGRAAIKADKWFSSVRQATAADYKEVEPLNGRLNIERHVSSGTTRPKHVVRPLQAPVDFAAGKQYTIVVMGGIDNKPLKVATVEDQLGGAPQTP